MTRSFFLASSAMALSFAQQGFAQTAEPVQTAQAETAAAEADEGTIIVTGSRIARPNLDSPIPILAVSSEELTSSGSLSIGDTLNDLPQLRSTYSQQNSTRNLGNRGLNLLDLRGLGTSRTLVLINGRRHVGSDVLRDGVAPDINTFPTDLIERVEISTGGASSIYGSDAIAGVVNFITKTDFEGVQVRGQGGISKYNDAGAYFVSGIAGKNFGDGRGNVAVNVEYAKSERFVASNRPNLRQNDTFVVVDSDPAGTPNGSDGVPDRQFFRDVRSATISLGGQTGIFYSTALAPCGRDAAGAAFVCNSLFQPDGALAAQTGTRIGLAPNGNYTGGNGYSGREGSLLELRPNLERIAVNLLGKYEFSRAAEVFFEAKYVRNDANGSQSGPLFSQGTTHGDLAPVNRERIRLDNPYLSAAARTALATQLTNAVNSGVNPNTGAAINAATQAATLAQINAGTFRFNFRRNWLDLGVRDENFRRETYRFVGGLKGQFNDDWSYELSANYGEHRENNTITGNVNVQRFLLALDSARDPATGNIVCRARLDPTTAGPDRGATPSATVLAADIAACVPLNPFGEGSVSQAARNYLLVDSGATGKLTQFVATGFIGGDSSQWFELPGGPVGFAIGAEYRRETNAYDLDDVTQAGYAFYNAIPSFTAPSFEVKEAYAEIRVPLVRDLPLLQELTVSGSGRVSDYKGATGTVFTYNGSVDWRPARDLQLRGSYGRATRAPTLADLYGAVGQNFAPNFLDPCSARNIATGSATRAANCSAAGRPAAYDFVYVQSLEFRSGGNSNLREETSTSFTLGSVLTPSFAPGLSLSVDYYDITVNKVIASVAAQTIVNQCYDLATLDNPFCTLFQRAGASGGPRGEVPFQILEGSLLQSTLNFAKLTARGVDTEIAYRRTTGWGSWNARAVWTRVLERSDFVNPADPNRENVVLGELQDPENQVNFNADVKIGKVTFGYELRWIDKMYQNTYEDFNSVQGRAPENADYATVAQYPSVFYHDVRLDYDANENISVYAGVDNVFNKQPPFGLTGIGAGSGVYNNVGRYFYAGAKVSF